jgi:DNA-binding MarR family transcriptional regulator
MNKHNNEINNLDDMQQIYSLLFIILSKLQADFDSKLEGLTSRQLMLMIAIAHLNPNEASIINISKILGTSKQNVNRLVASMINNGFLKSNPNTSDKRSVNIGITETGMELIQKNTLKANQYLQYIFHDFDCDEIKILRKMLERLADYDGSHDEHFEKQIEIKFSNEKD